MLADEIEARLAKLVADAQVRRRLPPTLQPAVAATETNCGFVRLSAATAEHAPWALTFQRGGGRWRLVAAGPVLP